MELARSDLIWLRTLAVELAGAAKESRGGRVFFDLERVDEIVLGLRAITDSAKKAKS